MPCARSEHGPSPSDASLSSSGRPGKAALILCRKGAISIGHFVGLAAAGARRRTGSGSGSLQWAGYEAPCLSPDRAAVSQSSAANRRAAPGRGGRCRRSSGTEARGACARASAPPTLNHRPALTATVGHAGAIAPGPVVDTCLAILRCSLSHWDFG